SWQPLAAALPDQCGDFLGVLLGGRRRELDVERHQGRTGSDEHRAARGMQPPWTEVRRELAGGDSVCERRRPATPQLGSGAAVGEDPVEEHGQLQLIAEQVGEHQRLGAGGATVDLAAVDDRRDIDRADARVDSRVLVDADLVRRRGGPGGDPWGEGPGRSRQREHAAVMVGIGVDVEQRGAERGADRVDGVTAAPLTDVGDRAQRTLPYGTSTWRPASSTARPSTGSEASSTTTSRWIGTETVPPIPALAPKATCTVPRIFSSSSTLPIRRARSLVPMPSSARLVPSSPCNWSRFRYSGPRPPSAATIRPPCTVNVAGCSDRPNRAREAATILPSPPAGAMKPSPQGRFPNAPAAVRSPSSDRPVRPPRSSRKSDPRGHVSRASSASPSSAATAWERDAIRSKSIAIARASMSSVTPGSVAPRAPASVARLRAAV